MSAGSVMRKWDLHVHTPDSFEHQYDFSSGEERQAYGEDIWKKYLGELEKVKDISVIGITDYFSIDGYKKVIEARKTGRLKNFDLVLPSIEFRLDKFVGAKRLNYHVILSDELDLDAIENEFLAALNIISETGEERALRRTNIENIGRSLKEQHKEFRDRHDYVIGCSNITVSLENILDILKKKASIFEGKYLLVLAESDWCLIDWNKQDHLTRKNILARSNAIFSSNDKTREWALGKGSGYGDPREFINEFVSLKPCIHGSDAHCFERLCLPDADKFCWIKADPTFEGLKQIMYEPEERVKICTENPEYSKNIFSLRAVKITKTAVNPELSLEECNLGFNPSLVTIIGGKGSGKTALLDLIANCFEDRCYRNGRNLQDKNSFVQRIEDDNPELTVELEFVGKDIGGFSKRFSDESFFKDVKLTYLPQGQIEEFSGDSQKLNAKIREIIFSSKQVIDAKHQAQFEAMHADINSLNEKIQEQNSQISKLEQDTTDAILSDIEDNLSKKRGELRNKEAHLKEIADQVIAGTEKKVEELRKRESELTDKHSDIELFRQQVQELNQELEVFQRTTNVRIEGLNAQLAKIVAGVAIPRLDFTNQFNTINEAGKSTKTADDQAVADLAAVNGEISKLEGIERVQADLLGELNRITGEIEQLEKEKDQLLEKRRQITVLEGERLTAYCEMVHKHIELKQYYGQVIGTFSTGSTEIMRGISFESSIRFAKDDFTGLGNEILDMRRVTDENIDELAGMLQGVIAQNTLEVLLGQFRGFVEKASGYKRHIKGRRTNADFYRWLFGSYFSLDTNIFFNRTSMDKLSIGQKGTVLLKLFLAEGDYPLIADMPEENLDNKFIYDELVGALRQAKSKRQLLIATNNANLVVNADAEQVVVAEFKNNVVSYRSGSIEDRTIRKEITTILEGGEEALKKREQKYGI